MTDAKQREYAVIHVTGVTTLDAKDFTFDGPMADATEVDAAVERLEPSNTHYMTGEEHARALLKTIPKGADQSEITFTLTGFDIAKFVSSFDALSGDKADS